MESSVHAAVPLRVGKKMRKRRELDALVGGGGARGGRLLSASSDEGEPWGRRASRRRRSRPFIRLAAVMALCVCVVSAATVLWLFVDVRRQIVSLRIEMDRVSTSSNSFDDALQVCHTAARELRANATNLGDRLEKLEHDFQDLFRRVEKADKEYAALSGAAPELAETPRRLHRLEITVANIGSQIAGIDNDSKTSKQHVSEALAGMQDVKSLLQRLETQSNETVANISAGLTRETELDRKVTALNATLAGKVEALEKRINELNKPTTTLAPPTVSTTVKSLNSTTTSSNTTTSTTPVPTQGQPSKPNVLHTEGTN